MNKKGKALSTVITFLILLIVFIITIWIFRDKVYAGMEKYGFIEKSIETQIEEIVKKPVSEITKEDIEKAAETQEGAEAMFKKLGLLEKDPLELTEEDLENAKILDKSIDAIKRLCEDILGKADTETKPEKKIKYYQKFIEVCPNDERVREVHFSIADLYCKIGEYSRALSKYESLITKYPKEKEKINREIDKCKNQEKIDHIKKGYETAVEYIQSDEYRDDAISKFTSVIAKFREILADEELSDLHKLAGNYIAASLYWMDYPKKDCQELYKEIFLKYDNEGVEFPLELYDKSGPVASWAYYDKGKCYEEFLNDPEIGKIAEVERKKAFNSLVEKYPDTNAAKELIPDCSEYEDSQIDCNDKNEWLAVTKLTLRPYRCFYDDTNKLCINCASENIPKNCFDNYHDGETCKLDPCSFAGAGYECKWVFGAEYEGGISISLWHCEEKKI